MKFVLILDLVPLLVTISLGFATKLDLHSTKHKNWGVCTPQSKNSKNLIAFLAARWLEARKLITSYNSSISFEDSSSTAFIKHIEIVNYYNTGMLIWNINNTLIGYARIFKCANEGIGINLNHYVNSHPEWSLRTHGVAVSSSTYYNFIAKLHSEAYTNQTAHNHTYITKVLKWSSTAADLKQDVFVHYFKSSRPNRKSSNTLTTFTFVREPMSRFESGMTEAAYRKVLFQSRYRLTNYKVNTTADVKNYIHQLLNFTKPDRPELSSVPQAFTDLEDINHIYPMAGAFFSFPIHTVGYLETFQEDWSNVIAPLYNLSKPFNYFVGRHATDVSFPSTKKMEAEPSNMRYYYRSLLRREPVYAKAICQLMLIDYVCLPQYPLPQVCEFLNSTREEGVRLLTAGRSTV